VRGDVIDIRFFVVLRAPILVGVVETTHRTFLDGAARTTIGPVLMRLPLVLGRGVRSEVALTRRCRAGAAGVDRPRAAEPSGPGRTTSRTARPGAAEAARAWSAESAAGTRPAGASFLTRTRFADRERPAFEGLLIESPDRFFSDGAVGIVDERKASRPAGFTVDGENYGRGYADGGKMFAEFGFRRRVRKVPDEQTD
jgi:hypothetical protein